jgi:shikimate dehydrogenase
MIITGKTSIYGILGNPVSHSLSPILHNFIFQEFKIDAVYVPFHLELIHKSNKTSHKKWEEYLIKSLLLNFNVQGLSVTIPYKFAACKIANIKDELSKFTKSSNTLLKIENQIYSYNTDGKGALDALNQKTEIKNKNILLIGYGGSASAIAGALLLHNIPKNLLLTGRNEEKAKKLVKELNKNIKHNSKCFFKSIDSLNDENDLNIFDVDIIINTTPVGMKNYHEDQIPIPEKYILKKHIVMDIIYNPLETRLLQIAKKNKATIIEGYWMFLYQAIYQMELFINTKIDKKLVKKLENLLLKYLK